MPRLNSPTARVLLALVAGLAIGSAVAAAGDPRLVRAVGFIEPLGTMWVNAIRMTVVPLVVGLLVTGVASGGDTRSIGRTGARALVLFLALLFGGGILTMLIAPPLLRGLAIAPDVAASLRATAQGGAKTTLERVHEVPSLAQRIIDIVPPNPLKAAADGAMLPLIVFTLALAFAVAQLAPRLRDPLVLVFRGVADAMLVLVGWVLAAAPVGIFALALALATRLGIGAARALAYYMAVLSGVLLLVIILLYPVAVLLGRTALTRFAAAAAPAQAVAFSTRSSLAALPAMIAGARDGLRVTDESTGFVLPLAVSVLRINVPPAWVVGVLFLGQLYGVAIDFGALASLLVTSVLLSFSVPGLPSASLFLLAPVLVGMGLPAEGVGILIAVDTIPDMFKTTANVTAHMTAAALLGQRREASEASG